MKEWVDINTPFSGEQWAKRVVTHGDATRTPEHTKTSRSVVTIQWNGTKKAGVQCGGPEVPSWVTDCILSMKVGECSLFTRNPRRVDDEDADVAITPGKAVDTEQAEESTGKGADEEEERIEEIMLLRCQKCDDVAPCTGVTLLHDVLGDGEDVRAFATVTCSYRVRFQRNDELIFSTPSADKGGVQWTLGEKNVMDSIENALCHMKVGGKAEITVPAEWGVGALSPSGSPVLRGADIIVDLQLLAVENPRTKFESVEELVACLETRKKCGNEHTYPRLQLMHYLEGIEIVEKNMDIANDATRKLHISLLLNAALMCLKIDSMAAFALAHCDDCLKLDPSNVKAYYRRAMAHKGMANYDACITDLRSALAIEPNNAAFTGELRATTQLLTEHKKQEKQRYVGLFEKLHKEQDKLEKKRSAFEKAEENAREAQQREEEKAEKARKAEEYAQKMARRLAEKQEKENELEANPGSKRDVLELLKQGKLQNFPTAPKDLPKVNYNLPKFLRKKQ